MIDATVKPNANLITNANGKFYAGMTLDEAKRNRTDKMLFRRDFKNIDKNGDGVLSVDEIITERKRSASNNKGWAVGFGITGLIDCINDAFHSWGMALIGLVITGALVGLELRDAKRTEEGTKRIEDMLANNEIAVNTNNTKN